MKRKPSSVRFGSEEAALRALSRQTGLSLATLIRVAVRRVASMGKAGVAALAKNPSPIGALGCALMAVPPSFERMAKRMRKDPAKLAAKTLREIATAHREPSERTARKAKP